MGKNKTNKANANCNQVILDHFWNICDQSEDKRCRSIQVILQTLAHQIKVNSEKNDVSYCINRLVTGLLSTREFARHGFCVLLTEILTQFQEQSEIDDVLSLAEKEFGENISNNLSSESAISWSLLLGCILKSNRVKANDPSMEKLFDLLYNLGLKKNYLEIVVCNLLPIYFDILQSSSHQIKKIVLEKIKVSESENLQVIFYFYVVLLAFQKFSTISENYLTDFIHNHIYKKKSKDYTKAFSLMRETTKYYPNIHPINELLIQTLYTIDKSHYSSFCSSLVDNIFKVNWEKTSLGFEIVQILLKFADSKQVSLVLSSNFLRLFIQTLSNKKHPLHNRATELGHFFVNLSSEKKNDSAFSVAFAKCFINKPGSINFDDLSKSKILASILRNFSNNSIQSWILMLKDMMITADNENIQESDIFRIRCLQQISSLIRSYSSNDQFIWNITKFLFVYAYFDISACKKLSINEDNELEQFNCPLTEKLIKQFSDSFKASFAHLCHLSANSSNGQQERLTKQIETLSYMVDFISTLIVKKKIQLISTEIDFENLKQTITNIKEKIEQISTKNNPASIEINVFKLIYLYFIIDLFENSDEIYAILPDFDECANRSLLLTKKSKKGMENKNGQSDEPLWADVLTDLFISLLTTKSKYTKSTIMTTFKHISPFVTRVGIQSLSDAILSKDTFQSSDSDSEDEGEDEDHEHETQGNEGDEKDLDFEEESDDDDEILEDDDEVEVDEQFKLDIIKALGTAAGGDDDDEIISDSEMFKIDESLAQVFKNKFGEKKRETERRNLIQTFKTRILELIQIVVEGKEMSLELTVEVLIPLLEAAKLNYAVKNMSPFINKCIQIFTIIGKKRFSNDVSIEEPHVQKALNTLIDFQYKCSHAELQKSLVNLTFWLIVISKSHFPDLNMFHKALERALKDFFDRPNIEVRSNLFMKVIPQLCDLKQESFFTSDYSAILIEYAFKTDIRSFKRCTAIEILCSLLNSLNRNNDQSQLLNLCTRSITALIDELDNFSSKKGEKQNIQTNNKIKLQYLNLLGKLTIACNVLDGNNGKINTLLKLLNQKLDSVPKEYRKKLDKAFVRKVRNAVGE